MKSDQSHICFVGREEVAPEIAVLHDALLEQRGVVANMSKILAHRPRLALEVAAFLKPLLGDGALTG